MDTKMKIIKFPGNVTDSKTSSNESDKALDSYDIEEWEVDYYFWDKKDYKGLVSYREERFFRHPDDLDNHYKLGEAYVLNSDYKKAIELLTKLYEKAPDWTDVQHLILDALFAIGKNENDFHWLEKPVVVRLDKNVIDSCYNYLKRKRKQHSVEDIYMNFLGRDYIHFTSSELLQALRQEGRFIIDNPDESPIFAEVRVKRNKGKK